MIVTRLTKENPPQNNSLEEAVVSRWNSQFEYKNSKGKINTVHINYCWVPSPQRHSEYSLNYIIFWTDLLNGSFKNKWRVLDFLREKLTGLGWLKENLSKKLSLDSDWLQDTNFQNSQFD